MSFFKKNENELILILDIQSSVVRGSLVLYRPNENPLVIFTTNSHMTWKPHTDSSYLVKVTVKALNETIESVLKWQSLKKPEKELPKKVKAVHVALSSPWVYSQSQILSVNFEKPTAVTEKNIKQLIDGEQSKIQFNPKEETEVIEQKILYVGLNGYAVANWKGKSAKQLDVSYTFTVAGKKLIERFRSACHKIAKEKQIFFHSSLLLQHIGLRTALPEHETYMVVNVHGELTDVAILRHGASAFFGSFPIGVETVVRKVSQATKLDLHSADSLINLFKKDHLDGNHSADMNESVKKVSTGWTSGLKKLLEEDKNNVQTQLIILSSLAHDEFFVDTLAEAYPKISIERMNLEKILPYVGFLPECDRRRHTGLFAIALKQVL